MGRKLLDQIIVIDVESTCWDKVQPKDEISEIIEIGIACVDVSKKEIVETESILVKPINSKVGDFCTSLTTLTQEQVDEGVLLQEACRVLKNKYKVDRRCWASWGDYDRVQFDRVCKRQGISYPFDRRHINIKTLFALKHTLPVEVGMPASLDYYDISLEGTHHRGVDDAKNIAKILIKLLE